MNDSGATDILLLRRIRVRTPSVPCSRCQQTPSRHKALIVSRTRALLPSQEDIPQHDRVVMKFVARAEYERDRALACRGAQLCKRIGMVANLGRVAAAEFLPACRVVPEPLPQRRASVLSLKFVA